MKQKIFELGHRYRVKASFMSGAMPFTLNEVLIFENDGYSSYDNSFAYEFRDESGVLKTWWLPEGKPADIWKQFFVPEGDN